MSSRRQSLLMIFLVALAFALSSFTRLRFPGLPVGISEVILVGCIVAHVPVGLGIHGGNQPNRFMPFLFLMLVATLPGYFGTISSEGNLPAALHDLAAFTWVVVLFAYLHFGFDHKQVDLDKLVGAFMMFSSVYFALVIVLHFFDPDLVYRTDDFGTAIQRVEQLNDVAWEYVLRLSGFSSNPNQLSLHCLVVAFFSLQLYKRNGFVLTFVCFGLAVVVGIMSKSDAFLFALIALVTISLFMGILFNKSVVLGLVLIVPSLAFLAVFFNPIVNELQTIASAKDQDSVRFELWANGISAGLNKPLIGLGPGAWSWSNVDGPEDMEEAHNSAIDYFTNAGLIGLTVLIIGMVGIVFKTLISKQSVLLGGVVALILFSMFHNVLRQPMLWLGFYYIAQQVWSTQSGRHSHSRRRRRRTVYTGSRGLEV